jgi:hypothetical protein
MAVIFGSTFSGQTDFSELTTFIAAAAEALETEFQSVERLSTRIEIPRGHDRVRVPFQNSIFAAQSYTDDDEITVSQRFSLDTLEMTISMLQISYRISERATRLAYVDLGAMAGEELVRARSERLEADLLDTLEGAGLSGGDATFDIGEVREALRALLDVARDPDGGPARRPLYAVVSPTAEFEIYADIGVSSASTTFTRPLASGGKIEEILLGSGPAIEGNYAFDLLGVPFFRSGYFNQTTAGVVVGDVNGFLFSKRALLLGVSKDWDLKMYDESRYPGLIVRSMADYGKRLGPFTKHVYMWDNA